MASRTKALFVLPVSSWAVLSLMSCSCVVWKITTFFFISPPGPENKKAPGIQMDTWGK